MKEYARDFYEGRPWRECREGFLLTRQYICERCGGVAAIAHHKKYITPDNITDPFVTLSHDNLEALCSDCHNKEHHSTPKNLRYTYGADGEIVYIPPI